MSYRNKYYHHGRFHEQSPPQTSPGKWILDCAYCPYVEDDSGCNRSFCDFCHECEGVLYRFDRWTLCEKCLCSVKSHIQKGPDKIVQCSLEEMEPWPYIEPPEEEAIETPQAPARDGFVYIIKSGAFCKIGHTKNPKQRFGEYTLLPHDPNVLLCEAVSDRFDTEELLHQTFKLKRKRGEWFKLTLNDVVTAKRIIELQSSE